MDCPANHRYRYHNYAPSPRFLGKEWKGQNHEARLPGGHRGRHQRGRRGSGNMAKQMNREDLYQSYPSHALLRGRVNSQQQKNPPPSWHPGRSMNYGPPDSPATFYHQRSTRVHSRGGGYSHPPKVHPKSFRPACASSKGLISIKWIDTVAGLNDRAQTWLALSVFTFFKVSQSQIDLWNKFRIMFTFSGKKKTAGFVFNF